MDVDTSVAQASAEIPEAKPNAGTVTERLAQLTPQDLEKLNLPPALIQWVGTDAALMFAVQAMADVVELLDTMPPEEAATLERVVPRASNIMTRLLELRNHVAAVVTFKAGAVSEGLSPSTILELHPVTVAAPLLERATVAESLEHYTPQPGDVAPTHDTETTHTPAGPSSSRSSEVTAGAREAARCWNCTRRVTKGHETNCINCNAPNPGDGNPLTRKRTA